MAAVLLRSAKRTNKGRFCRAKDFIRHNNVADRPTASRCAIKKQENERNVRDPEVCSGFSLRGRRVVEFIEKYWLRLWIMGAVGQLYCTPTALTSQYLAWDHYCTYVVQTPRVESQISISGTNKIHRSTRITQGRPVNTRSATEFTCCCV